NVPDHAARCRERAGAPTGIEVGSGVIWDCGRRAGMVQQGVRTRPDLVLGRTIYMIKRIAVLTGMLLAATAATNVYAQQAGGEAGPIHLRDMGNFYVGAEYSEPDADGNVFVS